MPNIGYILLANPGIQNPSTRISALNTFSLLEERGYTPSLLHVPVYANEIAQLHVDKVASRAEDLDIVYFQKVYGPRALKLARKLKEQGKKTVFGVCDLVNPEMTDVCDLTIVVSDYLRDQHPSELQHKVVVIHDGIEEPDSYKNAHSDHTGSPDEPLDAVVLTSSRITVLPECMNVPDYAKVHVIGNYGQERSFQEKVITRIKGIVESRSWEQIPYYISRIPSHLMRKSNGSGPVSFNKVPWNIGTVYSLLPDYDIGLIPQDLNPNPNGFDVMHSKSTNRLTQMMAAGLPVIASPVPSYEPIINQGTNGFLALTPTDWLHAFEELRDPDRRREMGKKARASVLEEFSQERQANLLVDAFNSVLNLEQV